MAGIALARLAEEYEKWQRDHPFGFSAQPVKKADGSLDLMLWECVIPGKEGTPWEGGLFKLHMEFDDEYPYYPPTCRFQERMFHPNIFEWGTVSFSILDETLDWRPCMSIKDILVCIQWYLDNPDGYSTASSKACKVLRECPVYYAEKIRELVRAQARAMTPNAKSDTLTALQPLFKLS